jgi:hypothetical protein
MWRDVLKAIARKYKLGIRFQETELAAYFPNGSVIYLVGMDTDESQKAKLLGQKYQIAMVDEAASFGTDLNELVYGVLKPAVADANGTVCLIGTPGNLTRGLFYDITNGKEPGWSLHRWTTKDNPYMKKQWAKELKQIKDTRPLFMETPLFKQHYLGEWVIESDKLVYRFRSDRNQFQALPSYLHGNWSYVLGIDLGYNDDSAFVLGAYHEHDPNLYVIECYKQTQMDITDVANKIKWFGSRYNIDVNVVDGANKQALAEMENRHSVSLRVSDRAGKQDFIEIMNAELTMGKIKLGPGLEPLYEEWANLIWDDRKGQRMENAACDNHLSDACLYMWRYCYSYLNTEIKLRAAPGTKEWYKGMQKSPEEIASELEQAALDMHQRMEEEMGYVREGLPDSGDWL